MRLIVAFVAVIGIALGMSALPLPDWTTTVAGPVVAAAQQQPAAPGKVDVDIDVNRGGGGGAWWTSPTWVAIGVIGVVLLVVIVAMIARGGGTTIVRE
jgi:hypothetical protein